MEDLQRQGGFLPIEAPEVASRHEYDEVELERLERDRAIAFVGTASKVTDQIVQLGNQLQIDKMALVTWVYDEDIRKKSFALIADAFNLQAKGVSN